MNSKFYKDVSAKAANACVIVEIHSREPVTTPRGQTIMQLLLVCTGELQSVNLMENINFEPGSELDQKDCISAENHRCYAGLMKKESLSPDDSNSSLS